MVEFDEEKHEYYLDPERTVRIPSASEILEVCGISNFSSIPEQISKKACEKGTMVHKVLELHDKGILDKYDYDEKAEPFLHQWKLFKKSFGLKKFDIIEEPCINEDYWYATTPDRMVNLMDIDIKTGGFYKEYALKTAAHVLFAENPYNYKRYSVHLTEDDFIIHEHKNPDDIDTFLSAIKIWRFKNVKDFAKIQSYQQTR